MDSVSIVIYLFNMKCWLNEQLPEIGVETSLNKWKSTKEEM
jgi:hypothetical protein